MTSKQNGIQSLSIEPRGVGYAVIACFHHLDEAQRYRDDLSRRADETSPASKTMSPEELREIADCSPERCHDALMWAAGEIERLKLAQGIRSGTSPVETASPQAPIAWIEVGDTDTILASDMYAPGLPPGTHDLYCEPTERVPALKTNEHHRDLSGDYPQKTRDCLACNVGNPGVYVKDGVMYCPHRPESPDVERQLAEDVLIFGAAYCRIDNDGTKTRLHPRTVMVDEQPTVPRNG